MKVPIRRLGSTAVIGAMAFYCCWPYMRGPSGIAVVQGPSKLREIAAAQLSPKFHPPPNRNPFQHVRETITVDRSPTMAAVEPANGSASRKNLSNALIGLSLNATYIRGHQRVALINGKEYAQGELLGSSESAAQRCIVAQILPQRVLIQCEGRIAELNYTDGVDSSRNYE